MVAGGNREGTGPLEREAASMTRRGLGFVYAGIILGFSYAQTRNLACPMLIHCIWNSGVVVVLTLLRVSYSCLKL